MLSIVSHLQNKALDKVLGKKETNKSSALLQGLAHF